MSDSILDFVIKNLKEFTSPDEVNKSIEKALADAGLTYKDKYNKEELNKFLDAMIKQSGFQEFVARSAKLKTLFL